MASPPANRPQATKKLVVVAIAAAVVVAGVSIALFVLLAGPRAQFAPPVREAPGLFRIDVRFVSPEVSLSSWAARVLEQGEEAIPPTNVASLQEQGTVGFQPHLDFLDDRALVAGEGDGRLDPGDAFYVGNLADGWTYTIELIWVGSGSAVARADFVG